jgi:hypothetical protein
MDWPVRTTILIDVHVPLPPLADGEEVTVMTDAEAFNGVYRGVLTEETDE